MSDRDSSLQDFSSSAIQTVRALMTVSGDEALAIGKAAFTDGTKGLAARAIAVFQRLNERRFGEALLDEIEEMRQAGKIREDFAQTDAGASSVREFFEMIGGKPDEDRFRAFCALFMSANAPDADFSEAVLDIELMRILGKLSAGEMHLLSAAMKMKRYTVTSGPDLLMGPLTKILGYDSRTLVFRNAQALIEGGLLSRDTWDNQGGTGGATKELLTDLGWALLTRVEKYNEFKKRSDQECRVPNR